MSKIEEQSEKCDKDGQLMEGPDGYYKEWHLKGEPHREDGPAIEYADGHKEWYINGKLHREDGPAIEWADGDKSWYLHDKLHRVDGPAVEWAHGGKSWWIEGGQLTEEDFNNRQKQV